MQLKEHLDNQLILQRKAFHEEENVSHTVLKDLITQNTDDFVKLQKSFQQKQLLHDDSLQTFTFRLEELEKQIPIQTSQVMGEMTVGLQDIIRGEEKSREGLHSMLASIKHHLTEGITEGDVHDGKTFGGSLEHGLVVPQSHYCLMQKRLDCLETVINNSFSKQAQELEAFQNTLDGLMVHRQELDRIHNKLNILMLEPRTANDSNGCQPDCLAAAHTDGNINLGFVEGRAVPTISRTTPGIIPGAIAVTEVAAPAPALDDLRPCCSHWALLEARVDHFELMLGSLADMVAEQVSCFREAHGEYKKRIV